MKKIITTVLIFAITLGIAWGISYLVSGNIMEYLFVGSLIVTIIVRIFTSTGGILSNNLRMVAQTQLLIKVEEDHGPHLKVQKSFAFPVSLLFTFISFITTMIYYWDKF
ncbi:MAG: hypothetical protein ACI35O_03165 [Bacillaceae bacterium]